MSPSVETQVYGVNEADEVYEVHEAESRGVQGIACTIYDPVLS
jgi:hypothetical protein